MRDGKKLICTVWFATSMSGDCGTESYEAVFTAKILTANQVHGSAGQHVARALGATPGNDLRLTVEPEEILKGHPSREVQILAEQGECFAEVRVGDEWLFFAGRSEKTGELEISYHSSNPSGPVEQRNDYVERLRRLARGDGLSFIAGEVDFPFNFSRLNHQLRITSKDAKQLYSVATDAQGRFEVGPVAPGVYRIDGDTDPQFRNIWDGLDSTATQANGCSFIRLQLEVNGEISGRVILPEGYEYTKSESFGNVFPLFAVEVDTSDGKQVRGTTIGDSLRFAVRGLTPGSYIVQLVNWQGESWLKMPVYAPGVTDTVGALRIDLGLAEHRTGLEIRVPPEALKRRTENSKN